MTSALQLSFDRVLKNQDRETNASELSRRSAAVLMPSHEAIDVRLLLENGTFDADTKQWWIECDPKIVRILLKLKDELGLSNVEIVSGNVEDFTPPCPLDYVNADMMSAFTPELGLWFENKVQPMLLNGASIIVNYTREHRRGDFLNWFEEIYKTKSSDQLTRNANVFRMKASIFKTADLLPRLLLCCALTTKHFDWFSGQNYQDKNYVMSSFRIDNIRSHDNSPWPSLSSLYADFQAQHTPIILGPRGTTINLISLKELQAHIFQKHSLELDMDITSGEWRVLLPTSGKVLQRFGTLKEVTDVFA